MSAGSDQSRPSFRFRDQYSRLKEKVKEKVKDKTMRHNLTMLANQNLTSNDTHGDSHSRHGFRQHMHHVKDVLKNKTHYDSVKTHLKDKFDDKFGSHENKTYPKGFYDSLFSPETENDVYLQTALICLWSIALLCVIPTIVVVFLPKKDKKSSTNMIFFHVFLCELFYLAYVLLAMINVAQEFRLTSLLCDFANYGMYVTIPIMQFALLFLSLERISKRFSLTMTWTTIFTKPYLIQVILCVIWIILIALLGTFMVIRKQFSFSFIKDQVNHMAPPILGDVMTKIASRRHHCSIDGRLSSAFKVVIIILFVILIVKPISFSLGFNLLTPYCCKGKKRRTPPPSERRTTTLVTIVLLLNLFFSFPFYFASMFNSIFKRIDSTKDTFSLVLKVCFILRITNIIFECLAFYIFERNSWNLMSKVFYYGTCKKFPIFKAASDDGPLTTKDPAVRELLEEVRRKPDREDDDDESAPETKPIHKTKQPKVKAASDNDDDDGAFRTPVKKKPTVVVEEDDNEEEEEVEPVPKRKTRRSKPALDVDEEQVTPKKRKTRTKRIESDDDDGETKEPVVAKRKPASKPVESDQDDDGGFKAAKTVKRKSKVVEPVPSEDESEASDDDNDKEPEPDIVIKKVKRKPHADEETHARSKARVSNGKPATHQSPNKHRPAREPSPSVPHHTKRRLTHPLPTPNDSETDASVHPHVSSPRTTKSPAVSKPAVRSASAERVRSRADPPPAHHHKSHSSRNKRATADASSSRTHKKSSGTKKQRKDHRERILDMSDEV